MERYMNNMERESDLTNNFMVGKREYKRVFVVDGRIKRTFFYGSEIGTEEDFYELADNGDLIPVLDTFLIGKIRSGVKLRTVKIKPLEEFLQAFKEEIHVEAVDFLGRRLTQ